MEASFSMLTTAGCTRRGELDFLFCRQHLLYRFFSGETCNPGGFNATLCPDAATCAANCALDGTDYANTNGVTSSGDSVSIVFGNGGARLYLLNAAGQYENFHVLNQEFTFDVDVSNLPCGYNGALYFSEMDPTGGLSDLNKAGAAYGTGYCDSQCPTGINFFDGTVRMVLLLNRS